MEAFEIGKKYFLVIKRADKEAFYTATILDKNETHIKVLDKFGTEKLILINEVLEADKVKE